VKFFGLRKHGSAFTLRSMLRS